ncbi:MAG TPA: dihydrolipoyl dehydrogenase [Gemmatimonadota bacterium]|nr:dihydrolipoyl dehydrogenase [Gemmatimonadota bacterium]
MANSGSEREVDVAVLGSGPAGYVAAIRAAQLGFTVACIEREYLGGTCLNVGCIPSKALLDASERLAWIRDGAGKIGIRIGEVSVDWPKMQAHRQKVVDASTKGVAYLFKKNGIEPVEGEGGFLEPGLIEVTGRDASRRVRYQAAIVATGSAPVPLPGTPFDGERVISSTEGLALGKVPKKLVVIGGGYIGLEMGSVYRRVGSEVTIVEMLDTILPGMDADLAKEGRKVFAKQGLDIRTGTRVTKVETQSGGVTVSVAGGEKEETIAADQVLVAIGRKPVTNGLNLDRVGIETDDRGFIVVNEHLETAAKNVYAVGDVIGGKMLAHKGSEEGIVAAERIAGKDSAMDYLPIPGVVYTHPEIASVGLTEAEAREAAQKEGRGIRVGRFPFSANGRARCMNETTGFVKMIADAETDRMLGCHIFGARAGDLIAEIVAAAAFRASAGDLALTIHAHPTLAEAVKEAALDLHGEVIHL